MPRPVHADAEATRRRLVDAAIWLFARDGFAGASTRDLAGRAGVNVATLSYYFKSKRGLYEAAVDEVYKRIGRRAATVLAGVDPSDIHDVLDRLYTAARAERDGIRLLVRQILDYGRLTPRTEARHFVPETEQAAQLIARQLGCPTERARSALVTTAYLVSRYVIQDEASLAAAFGSPSAAAAHRRVVKSLATVARALLGVEGDE